MRKKVVSGYVKSLSPDRFLEDDVGENWGDLRKKAQSVYENYYCLGR